VILGVNLLLKVAMIKKTDSPKALDFYTEKLRPVSEGMWRYEKGSRNGCLISQGSLQQILFYLSNVTFAIASPFVPEDGVSNNVERLASFRKSIQSARIPLYQIVGKWHRENVDTYSIDKGYILIKPDHMAKERFSGFLQQSTQTYGQDAFAIKSPGEPLSCVDWEGNVFQEYAEDISIDLLAKAYACRLPMDRSFSLEGSEISNGSIGSFRLFKGTGVEYYLPDDFFKREKVK
jgi:hypothetical protein